MSDRLRLDRAEFASSLRHGVTAALGAATAIAARDATTGQQANSEQLVTAAIITVGGFAWRLLHQLFSRRPKPEAVQ